MKKLIVLLCMILPLGAFAQEVKIAYVNADEIFAAMPEVKEMESKVANLNAGYEKEYKQMQEEFNRKYSDLVAQQDSLTDNIKLKRQGELQDLQQRIESLLEVAQQDVKKKQQEWFVPIQKKLQDAIKAVGDEKGYTYIITPQALLYTGPTAVDATPLVKAKLGLK